MRDLVLLAVQLVVTLAKLTRPGGVRSVVAESLLLKHHVIICRRSSRRAPVLSKYSNEAIRNALRDCWNGARYLRDLRHHVPTASASSAAYPDVRRLDQPQSADVIEYLQEENRVLKERLGGRRIRFTDVERRRLARKAQALGR